MTYKEKIELVQAELRRQIESEAWISEFDDNIFILRNGTILIRWKTDVNSISIIWANIDLGSFLEDSFLPEVSEFLNRESLKYKERQLDKFLSNHGELLDPT